MPPSSGVSPHVRTSAPTHYRPVRRIFNQKNHIAACGGIAEAITAARKIAPGKPVEIEVESLDELNQALAAGAETGVDYISIGALTKDLKAVDLSMRLSL
jgi:nicotinate-nucleotide pyrophosphorylase (carboxylating)